VLNRFIGKDEIYERTQLEMMMIHVIHDLFNAWL